MTTNTKSHRSHDGEQSARPTREAVLKAAGKEWDLEESKRAKAEMKAKAPWKGRFERQDKILLTLAIVIPAFFLLTLPLRPLFIADHPIGLAFVTGSHAAVGAGAAFASIGEAPLWLVIVAGVVGKIKIDWLFWWVGRRWGHGIVAFLIPSERGQRFANRLQTMNPWVMRLIIPLSYFPGVPGGIPHIIAGVNRMRLSTFLLLDAIGALMITSLVAAIGYASGQAGVDVVLLIDQYALWITLALIVGMAMYPVLGQARDQKARKAEALREVAEAYDAETARIEAGTVLKSDAGTAPATGASTEAPAEAASGATSEDVPNPSDDDPTSKDSVK